MQLTRRMASPSQLDWTAAKRVLRYLKGHRFPLTYSKTGTDSLPLHGYADANFAGDVVSRKSTGGYVFMFQKGAISWRATANCNAVYYRGRVCGIHVGITGGDLSTQALQISLHRHPWAYCTL